MCVIYSRDIQTKRARHNNKLSEILRQLEQLQNNISEIKMMLSQTRNTVSTAAFSREPLIRSIQPERITEAPLERLTESQLAILNEVKSSNNEVTALDIQKRLGYRSRATVSHNLNDLFKLGLLSKRRGRKARYSID